MKSIEILKENFETRKGFYGPVVRFQRMRATIKEGTNELFLSMVKEVPTIGGRARTTKESVSIRFWDFGKETLEENVNLSLDFFFSQEETSKEEEHFVRDVVYLLLPHTETLLTYAKTLTYRPKEDGDYTKFSNILKEYKIERPQGYTGDFWVAPDNVTYWYTMLVEPSNEKTDEKWLNARRSEALILTNKEGTVTFTHPGFPYDFHTEFKFCPDDLRAILLHRSQGSK